MCVDGVLGAGRGGGLRAVAAGAVQRVSAPPGGVGIQHTQRERQLIPGRAGLTEEREEGRKMRGQFCTSVKILPRRYRSWICLTRFKKHSRTFPDADMARALSPW